MKKIVFNVFLCVILLNIVTFSQWINVSPTGNDTTIYCVNTVNENLIYAARGNKGTVLRSTNGGMNWQNVNSPTQQAVNKIQFLNASTGFLAASLGLYKTTNGCTTWEHLIINDGLIDINFYNETTGYLISGNSPPKIYKTTNGGLNFTSKTIPQFAGYGGTSLAVTDVNTVYALTFRPVSDSSVVFKCTNWDSTFVPVFQTKPMCYDISFINNLTGIICGNMGALKRTTNGGLNWVNVNPGNTIIFQSVQMVNSAAAYVVGNSGSIFKSTNTGVNWVLQNSQVPWYLNDIHVLPGDSTGFAVGDFGTILKTTNGGLTSIETSNSTLPSGFTLFQNYPNPFNPVTKIQFVLPVAGYVSLKVFDITGRFVGEIVNGNLRAGLHQIDFNASHFSSGAYFYKLETKDYTDIKKMVLIK
jgi:photosystem II stability/assembly factor-like uncharacterized protein